MPREPISLVIAITVMADSCSRWCGRYDRDHQLLGHSPDRLCGPCDVTPHLPSLMPQTGEPLSDPNHTEVPSMPASRRPRPQHQHADPPHCLSLPSAAGRSAATSGCALCDVIRRARETILTRSPRTHSPPRDFTVIHNTGIRANLRDNSIRCVWSHRLARRAIDQGRPPCASSRTRSPLCASRRG